MLKFSDLELIELNWFLFDLLIIMHEMGIFHVCVVALLIWVGGFHLLNDIIFGVILICGALTIMERCMWVLGIVKGAGILN